MLSTYARARASIAIPALLLLLTASLPSCGSHERPLLPRSQTWAELRTVRRAVTVVPPGEAERAPYPRERLVDGEEIRVADEGLAWLRRDAGATLLVRGPARLTLRSDEIEIGEGRVFVDTPPGVTAELVTPNGPLQLAHVRASIDVSAQRGSTEAYVLAGEVRTSPGTAGPEGPSAGGARATAGERLIVSGKPGAAKAETSPALTWEDWTGGLATTDRAAQPAPFGVGTVGARTPGAQGAPHAPLAIQKLDVRVTVDGDLAVTEVDEVFFNPSSEVVEGVYRFRTPDGAALHRFGVDRGGAIMWGRVKEKQAAAAQYQSNVYQGSNEDPALLEWDAPGVYRARLYPIRPGEARRVVVQYAEWLGRTGPKGERRLYVYPMAAEGAEGSLPHIEELSVAIDLGRSGAKDVRTGMAGVREENTIIVREHDVVPRADLAVELYDEGLAAPQAYVAPHAVDLDALPPTERSQALTRAKTEADYVLVPLRPDDVPLAKGGLDLAIVVDTSAATDPASLAVARAATAALLAHLGKSDRAAVWAGDAALRSVAGGSGKLAPIDKAAREAILTSLARVERGGATDLGAMLSEAAASLGADPERRGAVVYIGDGAPTVGELSLADLRERMAKLPRPVRIFSLGIGDSAEMAILSGLARGAFAERIGDANTAARAALRLLEHAERPAWLSASIDLGPSVERVFPRDLGAVVADESLLIIGRLTGDGQPTRVSFTGPSGPSTKPLTRVAINDRGDLSRRWADARLAQMIDEGTGRAAMVDLGSRHGIITPVTSLYVPTMNEMSSEERAELEKRSTSRRNDGWLGKSRSADRGGEAPTSGRLDEAPARGEAKSDSDGSWSFGLSKGEEGSAVAAAPAAPVAAAPAAAPMAQAQAAAVPPPPPPAATMTAPSPEPATAAPPAPSPSVDPAQIFIPFGGMATGAPTGGAGPGSSIGHGWAGGSPGDKQGAKAAPRMTPDFAKNAEKAPRDDMDAAPARPADQSGSVSVTIAVGDVPHTALACGGAASVPFNERIGLWRERLALLGGRPGSIPKMYQTALRQCEAPTWRERSKLLSMMLDAIPTVSQRVLLWRVMVKDPSAADALYRGILARVRTPQEARELHDALGLRAIDPGVLEKLLKEARSPADRAAKLRGLVAQWPDDFTLALKLLDALEDAGDDAGARDLGRRLRARADADARVRTAVGELYLRLAKRAASPEQAALDEVEARRAFGEIVEFSPDDPVARRRLGDLLRAHGWYAEAARQYETLAKLAPDDAAVALLLAAAAEGQGKLEEAVKWAEKAGAAGAPDEEQSPARTARAFAATYLAWGRLEARKAGRAEEEKTLKARFDRLMSTEHGSGKPSAAGARVTLTWSHPELHPTLWSNALGAPMPAPEGDVTLGIAQAVVPSRKDAYVEVRLEPDEVEHAARLGAQAALTVVWNEGGDDEKIQVVPLAFTRGGPAVRRLTIAAGEVKEEAKP